jgi:hypothetical protein
MEFRWKSDPMVRRQFSSFMNTLSKMDLTPLLTTVLHYLSNVSRPVVHGDFDIIPADEVSDEEDCWYLRSLLV